MLLQRSPAAADAPVALRAPRTGIAEAGLFLVVVALPLLVTPFTYAPYADAKLVGLLLGATLLWVASAPRDRALTAAGAIWLSVATVAALTGVDTWRSLLGAPNQGTGVVFIAACVVLLVAGAGLSQDLHHRSGRWVARTAGLVAVVSLATRFIPGADDLAGLPAAGATVGHPAFVGAFLAVGLVAVAASGLARRGVWIGFVVLLGSAMSISANRAAVLGALLGLGVLAWRDAGARRAAARVGAAALLVLAAWAIADASLNAADLSAASRFGELNEGSARDRLDVWAANGRAVSRRPVLGWGPANGWGAYVSSVNAEEVARAGRGWGDAHNLFLETGVASGVLGLVALLVLLGIVMVRARRAPCTWALPAAAALAIPHLFQPLNLTLTPLLFLMLGMSARRTDPAARPMRRVTPVVVASLLIVGVALTGLRFASSAFERYGRTYDAQPALRWSMRLEPDRITAGEFLLLRRALDATSAEPGDALRDARRLARALVDAHPWDPGVRLAAAHAARFTGHLDEALRWVDEHLSRFPNDPTALAARDQILAEMRSEVLS